jgi:hypothetical protein
LIASCQQLCGGHEARLVQLAEELIVRNAESLRWAIVRGLDETFRKATVRFEERLDDTIDATRGVIRDALARRQDQSFAVQPELDRLAVATASLTSLCKEIRVATVPQIDTDRISDRISD